MFDVGARTHEKDFMKGRDDTHSARDDLNLN